MPWTKEQRAEHCKRIGAITSPRVARASAENGRLGGRPRKHPPKPTKPKQPKPPTVTATIAQIEPAPLQWEAAS